jgi:signal peptidase I
MDTSQGVNPSTSLALRPPVGFDPSGEDVLFLGKELEIDLWLKAQTKVAQSILIRTTTPEGRVRSAFMHVDGSISQVPLFDSEDPLVLDEKINPRTKEFAWSPEKAKRSFVSKKLAKAAFGLAGVIFLISLLTGFMQMRVVLTGSMEPAIKAGDLIIAASTKLVEPEVGKVVLYNARDLNGKAITVWSHRIIAGDANKGFTIKGDANPAADIGLIPSSDIQSVVLIKIPYIGHFFNAISLLLISAGAFLISWIFSHRKESP